MNQLVVGIDIGGTNTVYGLVDRTGIIHGQGVIPTAKYPDFDLYLQELYLGVQGLLKAVEHEYELLGIGIGAPNANHYQGTIENATNLPWSGTVPFIEKLQVYYPGLPILLTNDAKAAAVGEMVYGAARGMRDFVVITLGTGLGSGFVASGQLIYGHDSFAGELGHVIVSQGGRMCGCGRQGCLETYVSATGIKRTIFKLMADRNLESEFRHIAYNDLTSEMITTAALAGDPLAIEAYEYTGKILGQALADAVAITSPEAIFLFGGLAKAGKYIFEPTRKYMELSLLSHYKGKIKILPSGLEGKNVAILGAASLIYAL